MNFMKTKEVKDEVADEKDIICDDVKKEFLNRESIRMSRRTFVKMAGVTAGALAFGRFGIHTAAAAQSLQTPLAGSAIPAIQRPFA